MVGSQRMQAEQQLRASLKEIDDFKAALEKHSFLALFDWQGTIICVNDKSCVISKYPREGLPS